MRRAQYILLVVLAGVAFALACTIVVMAITNDRLQQDLQAKQQTINAGVLGPQGQQISSAILQDMANVALTNSSMRSLLKKHGYTVQNETAAPSLKGSASVSGKKEGKDE